MESKKRNYEWDKEEKMPEKARKKQKIEKKRHNWKESIEGVDEIDFRESRTGFDLELLSNEGSRFYCSTLYIDSGPFAVINSLFEFDPKLDLLKLDITDEAMSLMLNWTCRSKYDNGAYLRELTVHGASVLGNVALRYDCNQLVKDCLAQLLNVIKEDYPSELSVVFCEKAGGRLLDFALHWLRSNKSLAIQKQDVPERFWTECYKIILDKDHRITPSNMLRLLFVQETKPIDVKYIDAFFKELYRCSYVSDGASTHQALQTKKDHPVLQQFHERAFPFIMKLLSESKY